MQAREAILSIAKGSKPSLIAESLFKDRLGPIKSEIRSKAIQKDPKGFVRQVYNRMVDLSHHSGAFSQMTVGMGRQPEETVGKFTLGGPRDSFAGTVQIKVIHSDDGRIWRLIVSVQGRKHVLQHPAQASTRALDKFVRGVLSKVDWAYAKN